MQKYKVKEAGSMSLYISAIVLPLMFFLLSLSVDIGAYVTETQAIQKIADETSLYASRFLPSAPEAKSAVKTYLNDHKISVLNLGDTDIKSRTADVLINADSVQIDITSKVPMSFANIFMKIIGEGDSVAEIQTSASSLARATPLDVLIAMDTSSYLAPSAPTDEPWDEAGEWPAAEYFSDQDIRYDAELVDKRLLTQQCFNESFSALKRITIETYETLSSFRRNAVGLSFFPAVGRPVHNSRLLSPFIPESDIGTLGEASFQIYDREVIAVGPYASDEWCAASAEQEIDHLDYKFPDANTTLRNIDRSLAPASIISPVDDRYDPLYSPFLEAREVVWSKAAHSNLQGNFVEVLKNIHDQVIGITAIASRGGLVAHAKKVVIIFLGDLPYAFAGQQFPAAIAKTAIQTEIEALREEVFRYKFDLNLFIVGFNHQGNADNFETQGGELRSFLESFTDLSREGQPGSFNINFAYGDDVNRLGNQVLSAVMASQRTSMLSE